MLRVFNGVSGKDRISIYGIDNGVTAFWNQNGEIEIKPTTKNSAFLKFLMILAMLSLLKAFVIIPLIENKTIEITWYLITAIYFVIYEIFSISKIIITGGKELLRNHGAEHMVLSAYRKLKRVPTVEEAKQFSRISASCGITLYSAVITSQIIGFIVFIYTRYLISEILLFLAPLLFQTLFPFNFLGMLAQFFFTTSKPETKNLELAIAALSAADIQDALDRDIMI